MEDEEKLPLGILSDEIEGFKINWMTLWDGDNTSNVFWKAENWDMDIVERTETFSARILDCWCVSRQINFTSLKPIQHLNLIQNVYLFGNLIEVWKFPIGFVMPLTTNEVEQVILASDPEEMISQDVLSGNLVIETLFLTGEKPVYRSWITVIYE